MSAITIEGGNVTIPKEWVEREGLVIVTLAPNIHLIARADALAHYPHDLLQQLNQIARRGQNPPVSMEHLYSPRKARVLKELRESGCSVSGGEEYLSESALKPPSLDQVRQGLSSFKGSLADEIITERGEE